ncbi:hypothetical protein JCM10212_006255, partial [Sporobolomyces blumeae]
MLHLRNPLRHPSPSTTLLLLRRSRSLATTSPSPIPLANPPRSPISTPTTPPPPPPPPTTENEIANLGRRHFYLYYNLLFPLRINLLDPRALLTPFQRPQLLDHLRQVSTPPFTLELGTNRDKDDDDLVERYDVRFEEIRTREKDGGAFVEYSYRPLEPSSTSTTSASDDVPRTVERLASRVLSSSPTLKEPWFNLVLRREPRTFLVEGRPWMEDMDRFPAREIVVEFEGPE